MYINIYVYTHTVAHSFWPIIYNQKMEAIRTIFVIIKRT